VSKRVRAKSLRKKPQINIVYRPLEELVLDPRNPRFHSAKQIRQIARSIEAFGFNVPVPVNGSSKVIAGHGRILACRQLGIDRVPTVTLEHLTEAQARAFMIADNRLTENSAWDERLLAEQLKELSLQELDFDLDATGFEIGEIDLRIEGLAGGFDAEDEDNEIPDDPGKEPITRQGDLWALGEHRVFCGSALDPVAYASLLGTEQAKAVFSDPPYNVPIAGNVSGLGAIKHREFAMASGERAS
jgi:ParB-like chromosome segregation protein Spo0J